MNHLTLPTHQNAPYPIILLPYLAVVFFQVNIFLLRHKFCLDRRLAHVSCEQVNMCATIYQMTP